MPSLSSTFSLIYIEQSEFSALTRRAPRGDPRLVHPSLIASFKASSRIHLKEEDERLHEGLKVVYVVEARDDAHLLEHGHPEDGEDEHDELGGKSIGLKSCPKSCPRVKLKRIPSRALQPA